MQKILNRLTNHDRLSKVEARDVLVAISEGCYNNSQIAAFLTIYMMRPVSLQELEGFRDALLDLCLAVPIEDYNTIDLCGTGGDGKNTFNISTLASFIAAGAGVLVSKHGNYGVSSVSGSSNVLEFLEIKFSNQTDFLKQCLDEAGICILHAPLFHPAMKHVAPIRKELGVKTFFNMLGPMVNPAFPKNQMVGVFNLELARMYGYLYQNGTKKYGIVHALDGYDEISLTGKAKLISNTTETIVTPSDFNMKIQTQQAIYGGETVKDAAEIFMNILKGQGSKEQNNVVCANASIAISIATDCTLKEGVQKAFDSLENGRALQRFNKLKELSSI
ncbi:anthranilate phosphoribosyltransferase [Patiriisocius sp. Uisw_017]|jgi:anthranilate phosphoribosyltransferase|uniref:anthranilate phosphoribosyltransferase n=1 Tax=Patiriisocius sp. Uisw_017 TaxID=3230968 RepID=UPI0039EC25BC